jgi:DNA-binding transcriptional LysR family regulator
MKLDLNLLRVLVAIYDTRNLSAAASLLNVSQPTASGALARLRHAFGDPLFIRTPSGMAPTPRTEAIVGRAREVLDVIDRDILAGVEFDPLRAAGEFTFCMTAIAEFVFLPRMLPVLRRLAPGMRIRCISPAPGELRDGLRDGRIDLALGFYPDLVSADFYQQRLFSHSLVCVVREGHRLAGPRLTVDEFREAEHVVVKDGSRSSEMLEALLANRRIDRNVILTTSHYLGVPPVLAQSDAVAVAPRIVASMFAERYSLRMLDLPFDLPHYDLKQHWHRKFHHDPRIVWIRALVRREFGDSHLDDLMETLAA